MDMSLEHKKNVQKRILEILLAKYEKMELSEAEFEEISRFIVDKDHVINNHHDLIVFLRELTAKWNIFSFVLTLENGEVKQFEESKKVEEVEALTKEGKIDEALEATRRILKNIDNQ